MPKERNKADGYREKAYAGDTKAMNRSTSGRLLPTGRKNLGICYERGTICPLAYAAPPLTGVLKGIERMTQTIVYYLIALNIVTFFVYGIDKLKAKQGYWRISEATLLFLAVIGGCIGALLGMKVWHHKTMHLKFKYGLPLILLAQIALIYFIYA